MNYFNYFSEIEETFIRRRGRNLLLSPLDWALIESWQERGIPLHVVVRAIETVFDGVDKKPKAGRAVKSLFYCKEEIEAQYGEWLEMQTGKNGAAKISDFRFQIPDSKFQISDSSVQDSGSSKNELFSPEAIKNHLEKVSADLRAAIVRSKGDLRGVLEKVSKRLGEFEKNFNSVEKLEESLETLDGLLDEILLKTAEKGEISKLQAETAKQLASYKNKMERDVYRRTFDLMLLKKLRERAGIPRLSLFYL
ncbi:MAG TPA: hypothetical protein VK892_18705 [Pyrinomonadaceae bacterium]|nr:hypothetical protein [Pyrinomonadaceae bacterium]